MNKFQATQHQIEQFQRYLEAKMNREIKFKKEREHYDFHVPKVNQKVIYRSTSKSDGTEKSGYGIVIKCKTIDTKLVSAKLTVKDVETNEEVEVMMNSKSYPNDVVSVVTDDTRYAVYDSLQKTVLTESIYLYKADVEDYMTHLYGQDWRNIKSTYSIKKIKITIED